MKLTAKETATVLAALRYWQIDVLEIEGAYRGEAHFEDVDPMTTEEVNDLCERINCQAETGCCEYHQNGGNAAENSCGGDVPILPPMDPQERADLEQEAGRTFLSDKQAYEYRRRKLNAFGAERGNR